jgi:metallo-beta-lactamase family protein
MEVTPVMAKLTFRGGAGTVTGSCYLLESDNLHMLVDCGMFQGNKELRTLNHRTPLIPLHDIDYILLTHAHIDHSGLIPRFYKNGFRGKVLATRATVELCEIMLPDSGYIQEQEAEWRNRKAERRGEKPIPPLYTVEDATNCLQCFQTVSYGEDIQLDEQVRVRFLDAGHILGSAIIEVWIKEGDQEIKTVFSGDLGNPGNDIVRNPFQVTAADYLLIESTYGNRLHESIIDQSSRIKEIVMDTISNGGNVIIPAFAVGRTQQILYVLNEMVENGELPQIPVFIDSPLAVSATKIFRDCRECYNQEALWLLRKGDDPFYFPGLKYVRSVDESRALNKLKGGAVIISASGMCNAGRIKHHLKHNLWRPESAVIFIGFQAEGTLGRRLLDGTKKVKIMGEMINVAAKIYSLQSFSAHADQTGILNWISSIPHKPRRIFVVHGEATESAALAELITKETGIPTSIPKFSEEYLIKSIQPEYVGLTEPLTMRSLEKQQQLVAAIKQLEQKLPGLKKLLLAEDYEDEEINEINEALEALEERISVS